MRAETPKAKAEGFPSGIARLATVWVKRQNPYLCARPCRAPPFKEVLGEPHEVVSNYYPRYMIILSYLFNLDRIRLIYTQKHLAIGVFVCVTITKYLSL